MGLLGRELGREADGGRHLLAELLGLLDGQLMSGRRIEIDAEAGRRHLERAQELRRLGDWLERMRNLQTANR